MNEELNITVYSKCIKCGITGHIEDYFCMVCKKRHLRCTNCSWRPVWHWEREKEELERERVNGEIPIFEICSQCMGKGYVRK